MLKLLTQKRNKKGFTLAELLIVIAIIAILIAIAIPAFNAALNKAYQAVDDSNIRAAYAQWTINNMLLTTPEAAPSGSTAVDAFSDMGVTALKWYPAVSFNGGTGAPWTGSGAGSRGDKPIVAGMFS